MFSGGFVFMTTMGEKEMKTKTVLSIAIMAALPFAAHADPVGPAAVPANGTAVVATASAPYVTQTPTAADAAHIASTAYVKGAYNDAIAAVNKVESDLDSAKQDRLEVYSSEGAIAWGGGPLDTTVMGLDLMGRLLVDDSDPYEVLGPYIDDNYGTLEEYSHVLATVPAVLFGIDYKLDQKRVEIYTTWENDNAKQQVAFVTASGQ